MQGDDWTLSGNSTFNTVNVSSGILRVSGLFSPLSLSFNGGGLGGTGTITGSVSGASTISPGAMGAIGTLSIDGNFTSAAGSTFAVDINPAGSGDLLSVSGTATLDGGSVAVTGVDGDYEVSTDYSILTADGGVSGEFDDVAVNLTFLTPSLSYTANGVILSVNRRSGEIQEEIVEQTTAQQVSTSSRTLTQAILVRVDDMVTSLLPTGGPDAEQVSFAPGLRTGLSAGDDPNGWAVWGNITPTFFEQTSLLSGQDLAQAFEGTTWNLFVGADRLIGERGVIGGFLSYEDTNIDLVTVDGTRQSKGILFGGYAGLVVTNWLYGSTTFSYIMLNNDLSEAAFGTPTPVTGEFYSRRYTINAAAVAYKQFDQIKASAKVSYSYTRQTFDPYTTSDGSNVTPERSRLGRLSLGGEVTYTGETYFPFVNATFERDAQASGFGEEEGFVLGAGIRMILDSLSVDFYGTAESGRSGESSKSIGLNIRYTF